MCTLSLGAFVKQEADIHFLLKFSEAGRGCWLEAAPTNGERRGQQWDQSAHPVGKVPTHQVPWLPDSNHPDRATPKITSRGEQGNPIRNRLWCGAMEGSSWSVLPNPQPMGDEQC